MQELKKLVRIIDTNNSKVLPIIDPSDQVSLEGKLFHIIKADSAQTDGEACLLLYGEKKLVPSYRMLKSRLRKRLLNSLLFTELAENSFKISTIKHAECSLQVQQANTLLNLGEIELAQKLADQVISVAQKAELNDMLARAYDLKQYADLVSYNRSKFEKSIKMLEYYFQLEAKENEALILYSKTRFEISIGVGNTRKQGALFRESLLKLKELWKATGSSKIHNFYHIINIGYCEILGDFEGILEAIKETDNLLEVGTINKAWYNEHFNNYIKVYACLRLNRFDEGLEYSAKHLSSLMEGSPNWFAFLENYFILALYKRDYALAANLCKSAFEKGVFNNSILASRERWSLFSRIIKLISPEYNDIVCIPVSKEYKSSILAKDKEGYNLPLVIVEYLEHLPKLDEEDLEQYAIRFGKYTSKYLKGEIWARARLFIKLLLLSMKEEGNKLEQKAGPLLQKLKNTPPPRDPIADVEIVPYEHLWELVLTNLNNKAKL